MTRRFIVHLGTHKTGTSVIQRFLTFNEVAVARQGVSFIRLPSAARKLLANSKISDQASVSAFTEQLQKAIFKSRISFGSARTNSTFLLSWEGFCGNPLDGYMNASLIARRLRMTFINDDVSLILYLRPQDEFIESMYAQFIRQCKQFSFDEYAAHALSGLGFNWFALCEAYVSEFGRHALKLFTYESHRFSRKDSILAEFCQASGLLYEALTVPEQFFVRQNQAWPRPIAELARVAYQELDVNACKNLASAIDQIDFTPTQLRYAYFGVSDRQRLMQMHAASNSRVAQSFLDSPRDQLFSHSIKDTIQWPGLDHELSLN